MRIKLDDMQKVFSKKKSDSYVAFDSVNILECLHTEVILIPVINLNHLIIFK